MAKESLAGLEIITGTEKGTFDPKDLGVPFDTQRGWSGAFWPLTPPLEWRLGYADAEADVRDAPVQFDPAHSARAFRDDEFAKRLLSRLASVENNGRILLMLLGSIPSSSARTIFRDEILRSEKDGPTSWLDRVLGDREVQELASQHFRAPGSSPPGASEDVFPPSWRICKYWLDPASLLSVKAIGRSRPPGVRGTLANPSGTTRPNPGTPAAAATKKAKRPRRHSGGLVLLHIVSGSHFL